MSAVIKCVNKIRARGLNRRKFKQYCELLDMEHGDLILYCEIRWLSREKILSKFWELKNAIYNFLEEKNELPEERSLLCNNIWLFDFAFLIDISNHLNILNIKLQDRNKLFSNLVDDVAALKMKLRLLIAQLKNKNLDQFPH